MVTAFASIKLSLLVLVLVLVLAQMKVRRLTQALQLQQHQLLVQLKFVVGEEPSAAPIAAISKVSDDLEASLAPSLPEGDAAGAAGGDAAAAPVSTPKPTRKF
ncbi:hypothetical protein V6N13_013540 [Hibiscus sabdariffa]|uniref:Uncharacterized protein n=1 Tax=Hibiscus sabdariffa TaxID=183260 RepID=A0ABR2BVK8_9ROSI